MSTYRLCSTHGQVILAKLTNQNLLQKSKVMSLLSEPSSWIWFVNHRLLQKKFFKIVMKKKIDIVSLNPTVPIIVQLFYGILFFTLYLNSYMNCVRRLCFTFLSLFSPITLFFHLLSFSLFHHFCSLPFTYNYYR